MSTHVVVKCTYTVQLLEPITKRWGLGPISQFNPATFLCLSQARTLISNVICCGIFLCSMIWVERWLFVLMNCLNCLFITDITWYKIFIDQELMVFLGKSFSSTKITIKYIIIKVLLKVVLNTNYSKSYWCQFNYLTKFSFYLRHSFKFF
jgi:hypothetical protein